MLELLCYYLNVKQHGEYIMKFPFGWEDAQGTRPPTGKTKR
jgi:hypothetical protein